jgi:hypothetical protein
VIKSTTRHKGDAAGAHRDGRSISFPIREKAWNANVPGAVGGKNISPREKQSVDNIGISNFSRQMQRGVITAAQHMSIDKGWV